MSGGPKVFYHFFLDRWRNENRERRRLERRRRINPKIIFLLLKENDFFGHRLHFGNTAASKSKLKLLWIPLVLPTTFLTYTQKIRQINIVWRTQTYFCSLEGFGL